MVFIYKKTSKKESIFQEKMENTLFVLTKEIAFVSTV